MRIVYMGTPDFAISPLKKLKACGHDIIGVFTQPDKPKNRGLKFSLSPVKTAALELGIPVYQPVSMSDGEAMGFIREMSPDIITVVAYGKLLPKEILEYPKHGCINIHGSLLPKFRGSAPIQWSVLSGETETGVTSMYMAEEMDAGDIISTKKTEIGDDETSADLYERLSFLGADLLCETVDAIESGTAVRTPQNHAQATLAPPLTREMSPIDWTKKACEIKNKVRGLNPWPVATAEFSGTIYKIYSVSIREKTTAAEPGKIICADKNGFIVSCDDGAVEINELQAPGKRRMTASDYLRGHKICL